MGLRAQHVTASNRVIEKLQNVFKIALVLGVRYP